MLYNYLYINYILLIISANEWNFEGYKLSSLIIKKNKLFFSKNKNNMFMIFGEILFEIEIICE